MLLAEKAPGTQGAPFGPGAAVVGVTGKLSDVGLHGMGGIGKTVLAAAAVRDPAVQAVYPDGVYWLTVGQQPNVLELQTRLAEAVGVPALGFRNEQEACARLRQWCAGRRALVVLDDVWEARCVRALDVLDAGRLVISTRVALRAMSDLGAEELRLDVLSDEQSLALLAHWSGQPLAELSHNHETVRMRRECGNLPLALAVCGAMARGGVSWASIGKALTQGKLKFLKKELPDYRSTVYASLEMGVAQLEEEEARRYRELAVFPADAVVPEGTVSTLWAKTGGLEDFEAEELLVRLGNRSLLALEGVDGIRKRWRRAEGRGSRIGKRTDVHLL